MSFSVLIPTLWKSLRITPLVEAFEHHPLVDEIIVLDNARQVKGLRDRKLTILEGCEENYVTKSWNTLVNYSKSEYYAILNDDILLDPNILYEIKDMDWTYPSIVGLNWHTRVSDPKEAKNIIKPLFIYEDMPYGFGQALFGKKAEWPEIPEYLRIWCNDNYLASVLVPHSLNYFYWDGEVETTSGDPKYDSIKQTDVNRWKIMCEKGLI